MSQAWALSMVASKSLARRRLRLSQAMVRSTTHRRGNSWKPLAASQRRTISRVQLVAELGEGLLELSAGVGGISEDVAQPGKGAAHGGEQQRCAVAILDVGRMHDGGDEKPRRVGQQMALASLDLLAGIVATRTAGFGRLHRLTVDDAGRRARLACFQLAGPTHQRV